MTRRTPFAFALAAALLPAAAAAQDPDPGLKRLAAFAPAPIIGWAGGSLVGAVPSGEFRRYVAGGAGFNGFVALKLGQEETVSLRLDGTFVLYGLETRRVPLGIGPLALVNVDVSTSNSIVNFVLGPQLITTGGAVRAYASGGVGFSYFWTHSSVEGSNNSEPFASSTNFDDFTFAWRAGGGLWIRVGHGRTPLWLDLGATYVRNGRVKYLREGSITFDLSGAPVYTAIESETNLVLIHLGVSAGLRPGR
jgi:opacity protein-like surface antigen